MKNQPLCNVEFILGNSNSRFSGVTSTMLQVLDVQKKQVCISVMGKHHIPDDIHTLSFIDVIKLCRTPLQSGLPRVFHARRNDEMIQALILKYVFCCDIKVIFTSTAQRKKTWITRWLMARMDGLITTCNAARSYMNVQPDAMIPHGVDSDRMTNQLPQNIPVLPDLKKIGIFGRVRSQKGVDLFVEALIEILQKNKDWAGVIVGQTTKDQLPFRDDLAQLIMDAGLSDRIVFLGEQSFDAIPHLYRSMDIVTSLSVNEGFGLTVLEAMSVGKPVVATKAGAWPDIIENGSDGYLIDVGDKIELKEKLVGLMANSKLRSEIGLKAKLKVDRQYTVEREAADLVATYREIQKKK